MSNMLSNILKRVFLQYPSQTLSVRVITHRPYRSGPYSKNDTHDDFNLEEDDDEIDIDGEIALATKTKTPYKLGRIAKQLDKDMVKKKIVEKKIRQIENPKEPNLLTWSAKMQIKYLNQKDPDEWRPEVLAESFPVSKYTIINILKNKQIPYSEVQIFQHDVKVHKNWQKLKEASENAIQGGPVDPAYRLLVESEKLSLMINAAGSLSFPNPKHIQTKAQIISKERPVVHGKFSRILSRYAADKEHIESEPDRQFIQIGDPEIMHLLKGIAEQTIDTADTEQDGVYSSEYTDYGTDAEKTEHSSGALERNRNRYSHENNDNRSRYKARNVYENNDRSRYQERNSYENNDLNRYQTRNQYERKDMRGNMVEERNSYKNNGMNRRHNRTQNYDGYRNDDRNQGLDRNNQGLDRNGNQSRSRDHEIDQSNDMNRDQESYLMKRSPERYTNNALNNDKYVESNESNAIEMKDKLKRKGRHLKHSHKKPELPNWSFDSKDYYKRIGVIKEQQMERLGSQKQAWKTSNHKSKRRNSLDSEFDSEEKVNRCIKRQDFEGTQTSESFDYKSKRRNSLGSESDLRRLNQRSRSFNSEVDQTRVNNEQMTGRDNERDISESRRHEMRRKYTSHNDRPDRYRQNEEYDNDYNGKNSLSGNLADIELLQDLPKKGRYKTTRDGNEVKTENGELLYKVPV